jgi:hypothetical protein
MAPKPKARPSDFTGRQREALVEEHAEEVAEASERMALANATKARQAVNSITDLTDPTNIVVEEILPEVLDEVEEIDVQFVEEYEVVIPLDDLEDWTYGAGNHLSLKQGQKYRVKKAWADHLREKGYLYDTRFTDTSVVDLTGAR